MKALSALAIATTLAACLATLAVPAVAQQRADPDWPCVQRKVPELSVAGVWSGPEVDPSAARWQEDKEISELATQLASRRVPVEEATSALKAFAETLKPDEKAERLPLLFAGLFVLLDRERGEVMSGIERYGRAQKAMAEQIRADQSRLSDLNSSKRDPQQASALTTQLQTQVRIFNDRSHSLTYVCEVPTLIEQRLFALARAIQSEIQS